MVAGPPRRSVSPPDIVLSLAAGRPVRAVWENEIGGLTFEIGREPHRRFVKWQPSGLDANLDAEIARLRWARQFVSVTDCPSHGLLTSAWRTLGSELERAGSIRLAGTTIIGT